MSDYEVRIRSIDHVVLKARDAARLVTFYCEVLGCTVEREVESIGLVQLRAGACLIDVVPGRGEIDAPNFDHFCLTLEAFDADALCAHLARHGVESHEPVEVYGAEGFGPSIYIRDPEDNQVELKGDAVRGL